MEIQKQEQVPQELTPLKTGDLFLQAVKSKKLSEASQEEIKQALRYAMMKIGLRAANFPDAMERDFLIIHLIQNFPWLPVDEIKIAFDWAISEKLELGKEGYNCYENFSCAYLSRILNAYWRLASRVKVDGEFIDRSVRKEIPFSGHISGLLNE